MGFVRKHLSADGLHRAVRQSLYKEDLPKCPRSDISWQDCIMTESATLFSLVLEFQK